MTIEEGFGDPELVIVFAAIALRRAGKVEAKDVPQVFERLSDAPFGERITLETDVAEEDDDAGPPAPSSSSNGDASGASSTDELGDIGADPGISLGCPPRLLRHPARRRRGHEPGAALGCADLFAAMYGGD